MIETDTAPVPVKIILHKLSRTLELEYENHKRFILSCTELRIHSLSAETRETESDKDRLRIEKQHVNILSIEPVGHYAIKPVFSDGHRTGIYSWATLYKLAIEQGRQESNE